MDNSFCSYFMHIRPQKTGEIRADQKMIAYLIGFIIIFITISRIERDETVSAKGQFFSQVPI
ncbi:hypothetical protein BES34_000170 [Leptospira inadai serovar Lyme]|uniref:Uncharacterized protein n=1 Tax=Leptospira inadai serovar Lyme TaxID=293084 RepID=A0ABX4YN88_9LEPT|nr:hypothetical protein BES34_000170 [Leptospira inadai serovar Lyme]